MVRKPGQPFNGNLTDEELLNVPARMLSPELRRRRRAVRNAQNAKGRRKAREERIDKGKAKIVYCQAYTLKGTPCQSYAVVGAKHCIAHLNAAERSKLGVKRNENGQRVKPPKVQSAPKLMRMVIEAANEKVIARYFTALGLELAGFDEQGNPVIIDHGIEKGIRLYGESKEGYIEMSNFPDLQAQIHVLEKLMDRTYGRPKQTTVLEGGEKPVQVTPVKSEDRAKQVISVLQRSHAVRMRRQPGRHTESEGGTTNSSTQGADNVIPLNDDKLNDD